MFMSFKCSPDKRLELGGIWEFDDYLLWYFGDENVYYQHLMPAGNYFVKGDTLFVKDVYSDFTEDIEKETFGFNSKFYLVFLITEYSQEKISLLPIGESWMQNDIRKEYELKRIQLSKRKGKIDINLKIKDRENSRLAYEITGDSETGFGIIDNKKNISQKINFKNEDVILSLVNEVFENDSIIVLDPNEIISEYYFELNVSCDNRQKTYNFNFYHDTSNSLKLLITMLVHDNDYKIICLN